MKLGENGPSSQRGPSRDTKHMVGSDSKATYDDGIQESVVMGRKGHGLAFGAHTNEVSSLSNEQHGELTMEPQIMTRRKEVRVVVDNG